MPTRTARTTAVAAKNQAHRMRAIEAPRRIETATKPTVKIKKTACSWTATLHGYDTHCRPAAFGDERAGERAGGERARDSTAGGR